MVEINNFGLPPEFPEGKDFVIEKFIELILKNAPKYDYFSIYEMNETLSINEIERKQFKHLFDDLRRILINKRLADFAKGSNLYIELTEQGRNYFSKNVSEPINFTQNIENYVGRDNHGTQSSVNDFKIKNIKQVITPKPKKNQHKSIISTISNLSLRALGIIISVVFLPIISFVIWDIYRIELIKCWKFIFT